MLVPLGVLAFGAIFSGMVFYKPFFGDHHAVEEFFGITQGETHALVLGTVAYAASEAKDDDHGDAKAAPVPGQGAIYMAPDNHVLDDAHHAPKWVKVSPFIAMLLGFITAWWFYIKIPSLPGRLATPFQPLYQFLLNKWYFDEIYDVLIVKPAIWLGNFLWKRGDGNVIDGSINGVAMGIVPFFTRLAGKAQSGFMFHYAFAMVLGIVAMITWFAIGGGAE
jgi:NADH-quinone oxidoreductase subunit L